MFAGCSKISAVLDGKDSELPVGMLYKSTFLMREFAKIFKITAIYNNNGNDGYVLPRQTRMSELIQTPLRCILADNLSDGEEIGKGSEFNFHPVITMFVDVPPHSLGLNTEIKPLIKNAVKPKNIYASVFTSKLLCDIYNFDGEKRFMELPVRSFWNVSHNPTKKCLTHVNLPIDNGRYDNNKLFQFQNRYGGVILNTVGTSPGKLQDMVLQQYATSSYILNLSYCSADIYPFILAAACGCPVISLTNKFIEEYFGDTSFFIDNISELGKLDKVTLKKISSKQKDLVYNNNIKPYDKIVESWDNLFTECSRSMVC